MHAPGLLKSMTLLLALGFGAPALVGCEDEGPAEQAGEKVDEAVEDTERAVDDATD